MEISASALTLAPEHVLRRARPIALGVGIGALALCAVGALLDPQQFFRSYLVGFLYWFGISLGCLAILMVHHIAGGGWGAVTRRVLEAAASTIPLLALLFIPIALGVGELYEWAHPAEVAADPILRAKQLYLNVPFFLGRAVFYFVVWSAIAATLVRWSSEEDTASDGSVTRRLELLSRGGLVLYGLTVSFAAIDWMMSLEPHWFSTIYGLLVMGGQGVAAFAFTIPVAALLLRQEPLAKVLRPAQFSDLGSLLLAFVMVWAYLSLSQLLITYSGNLPEEISWYLRRTAGGWRWVGYLLIAAHFVVPFLVLLSRDLKRNARALAVVALWLILVRYVDLYWLVVPSFEEGGLRVHWMDAAAPIGVGGIWLWTFIGRLCSRPVVPLRDSSLPEAVG